MNLNLQFPFYSPLLNGTRNAARVKKGWPAATSAANLTMDGPRNRIIVPRLTQVEISNETGDEIRARVDMSTVGKTSRDLQSRTEIITSVLHAFSARVERIDPAHANLIVSFDPPSPPLPHMGDGPLDLEQFPIHLDPANDTAASIYLTKSVLIGGESESGKSNLVWYILSQLNSYQIPYRLHVIDPAGGVELADLETSPLTRQYVDRVKDIATVVASFRNSMDRRLEHMKKAHVRRHIPTTAEPVEILIIDEILLCKAQLQGGDAASPLGEILASGRKALHIVLACSQLGQKEVIGQIRDLFAQRICLRTRTGDITDAVLGTNATVDGANCHRITNRGEGYVFTDTSGVFEKFHAPLVRETAEVATGGTTTPTIDLPKKRTLWRRSRTHFVYQFFDDPNPNQTRPVYVGISDNPRRRFREHERDWPLQTWLSIVQSRTKIRAYQDWDAAKDMETKLIQYYSPKYNVQERSF